MPELPEVETIRRGLNKFILKKKLVRVERLCEKSFVGDVGVACGMVTGLRRYGKALIIDLDNGKSLMVHLRMTGQLIYDGAERYAAVHPKEWDASFQKEVSQREEKSKIFKSKSAVSDLKIEHMPRFAAGHPSENFFSVLPNKQTRVVLEFEDGTLYFNDQRKFGFIKVLNTAEVERDDFIKKLAPEPWVMGADEFYEKLQRHKNALIKAVILDQTIICGLGNIYADEALFEAGIHPERRAGTVSQDEARRILEAARVVMDRSIASGGSTMATYVKADGTRGDYLEKFAQVFRREGQPCVKCGTKIEKIRVAGRGTHICPCCQQLDTCTKIRHVPKKEKSQ